MSRPSHDPIEWFTDALRRGPVYPLFDDAVAYVQDLFARIDGRLPVTLARRLATRVPAAHLTELNRRLGFNLYLTVAMGRCDKPNQRT